MVARQVKRNHRPIKEQLDEIGIESFVPLISSVAVVSGRHVHRLVPIFGRYIFFVINELWKNASNIRGVSGLMLTAEFTPAIVIPSQMRAIQALCVNGMYQLASAPTPAGFSYGQRVTPTSGPLEHHIGRYDGTRSRHRDVAFFNLFGREQKITFKAGELIAA